VYLAQLVYERLIFSREAARGPLTFPATVGILPPLAKALNTIQYNTSSIRLISLSGFVNLFAFLLGRALRARKGLTNPEPCNCLFRSSPFHNPPQAGPDCLRCFRREIAAHRTGFEPVYEYSASLRTQYQLPLPRLLAYNLFPQPITPRNRPQRRANFSQSWG
jgi:hypothetical protein